MQVNQEEEPSFCRLKDCRWICNLGQENKRHRKYTIKRTTSTGCSFSWDREQIIVNAWTTKAPHGSKARTNLPPCVNRWFEIFNIHPCHHPLVRRHFGKGLAATDGRYIISFSDFLFLEFFHYFFVFCILIFFFCVLFKFWTFSPVHLLCIFETLRGCLLLALEQFLFP